MDGDHGQKGMVGMVKDVADDGLSLRLTRGNAFPCWNVEITWPHRTRYEGTRSQHIVLVSQFSGSSLLKGLPFAMGPGSSSMILSIPIPPLVWVLGESLFFHAIPTLKNT
jgi:hypothetical protein